MTWMVLMAFCPLENRFSLGVYLRAAAWRWPAATREIARRAASCRPPPAGGHWQRAPPRTMLGHSLFPNRPLERLLKMKLFACWTCAVWLSVSVALPLAAGEPGFESLFDGKTLDGWE